MKRLQLMLLDQENQFETLFSYKIKSDSTSFMVIYQKIDFKQCKGECNFCVNSNFEWFPKQAGINKTEQIVFEMHVIILLLI